MKKAKSAAPSGLNTSSAGLDGTTGSEPQMTKPQTPSSATPGLKGTKKEKTTMSASMLSSTVPPGGIGGEVSLEAMSHAELIEHYADISQKYEQVGLLQEKLSGNMKRKSESYVRREVQYKSEISHLKETLEKTVLCRGGEEVSMPKIRQLHGQIMKHVEEMQDRSHRIVDEHERDLLRQFRSKLLEIEDRMKRDMSKVDDVSGVPRAWLERTTKLSKEVDKHKEQAIRLDRINEVLTRNIEKFRAQCRSQEVDREALVRQLVSIKKENSRLTHEIEKMAGGTHLEGLMRPVPSSRLGAASSRPGTGGGVVNTLRDTVNSVSRPGTGQGKMPPTMAALSDAQNETARYAHVVERLRKLLEQERRAVREIRGQHMRLLAERTELEGMLREAVDEVKADLGLGLDPQNTAEIQMLTQKEREGVLERLLGQERTILLLYDQQVGRGQGQGHRERDVEQVSRIGNGGEEASFADSLGEVDVDDDET